MQIMAERRDLEMSDSNIETVSTVFLVQPGETVEALLRRMGVTGAASWHFEHVDVRLKLVKPAP